MKNTRKKIWPSIGIKLYAIAIITFISIFFISCDIPETITVKGDPGLYVPLGSPFANMEEEERLEHLISADGIKKMMDSNASEAGAENELVIYDVSEAMAQSHGIDPKLQTYLVHYPLTEMPLDLEKYLNDKMDVENAKGDVNIPDIPGLTEDLPAGTHFYIHGDGSAPGTSEDIDKPLLTVPLNDMVKLIRNVTRAADGRFGIKINYTPQLARNLELKIPAFGIDSYIKGTPDPSSNPTELIFADQSGTDFNPRKALYENGDDRELRIYARISGPCSETLTTALIFEWVKAVINTNTDEGSAFKAEYPIGNSLGDFLGGGAVFKEADGYLYMSGLDSPDPIVLTVDIGDGNNQIRHLQEAEPSLTITEKTDGTKGVSGGLTTSSFTIDNPAPLNLAPIFENEGSVLKIDVSIEDFEIFYEDIGEESIVKFNLYIMIPMTLKISEIEGEEAPDVFVGDVNIRKNYVPLDLGDALRKMGEGDLFAREEGKENLINDVSSVEIHLRDIDISIVEKDNLAVLVKNKDTYKLLDFTDNTSLNFGSDDLCLPFSPEFSVLLKKDSETSASFDVLRAELLKFDFKLDVKAKAKIDYTINF